MAGLPTTFRVVIAGCGEAFVCRGCETLLEGMSRLGLRRLPSGCRGGGYGVCKVRILSGQYVTRPMSRSEVSEAEEQHGAVLACRVYPRSDVLIEVVGKLERHFTIPRVQAAQARFVCT